MRREAVHVALGRLPERERRVLQMRFGLDGHRRAPLREAGRHLGLSSEGVRKLESRALRRLAEARELEGLTAAA